MKGTQNQYLFIPDQHTDFPFPVFAEDWGFLGSLVLMGLYAFLVIWAIKIASQAKDRFGAVLSVGMGAHVLLARLLQPPGWLWACSPSSVSLSPFSPTGDHP